MPDPKSGAFILEQLERSGSDPDRTHEVSFWLYFGSESSANLAARRGKAAGLVADVVISAMSDRAPQWLCLLYCSHIPDEGILDNISKFCSDLAEEYDGQFDGWEARLELPE